MSLVKKIEILFWKLNKNSLKSNDKFKDIHKGKTGYIIGNGSSLKYFDLSVLSNLHTLGTSYTLIDNRLKNVDLSYCVFPSAYLFFPLWKSRRSGKFQLNYLSPIFKTIIKKNKKTQFFISLTDKYAFFRPPKNINFIYHFGKFEGYCYDISNSFSVATGGLDFMLGVAKYLGFSKLVLLGCDYLGSPCIEGHFYSKDEPYAGEYKVDYVKRIQQLAHKLDLDILTIFPEGINCRVFKSQSFSDYFKIDEQYHNQSQIIDDEYIPLLEKADIKRQLSLYCNWEIYDKNR